MKAEFSALGYLWRPNFLPWGYIRKFGYIRKYPKISENIRKFGYIRKYPKISENKKVDAHFWRTFDAHLTHCWRTFDAHLTHISENIRKYPKISENIRKFGYIRKYPKISENSDIYPKISENKWRFVIHGTPSWTRLFLRNPASYYSLKSPIV